MTQPLYLDHQQPLAARVHDLIGRMTLAEKVGQMCHTAPAIPRLGIPAYDWWNEALHGVARAGVATVFPQAIGMAATWNPDLIGQIATVISDEARAKYHEAAKSGHTERYYGLTMWSPNINIYRDPRWGRGQETYGEDPYLTARFGVAFVRGLQGDNPRYLKTVATVKHYAVHSGPEADRHHFDARVDDYDLWTTYLPAFEAGIKEARAASIMTAYNRVNGLPCSAHPRLIGDILRDGWGFAGYVVSDCGAINDIYGGHTTAPDSASAAALAVHAGCDLECGCVYESLVEAVERGLITESALDTSLYRLFGARFRLGMFDPDSEVPYSALPMSLVNAPEHRALAREAARQSMVLLKNAGALLPLSPTVGTIAVIGPNADDELVLRGNYFGTPAYAVTPLVGIRAAVSPETTVLYAPGCGIIDGDAAQAKEALRIARQADVIVFVGGLSQLLEGEEGQEEGLPPGQRSLGDRTDLALPAIQRDLLKQLHALGKPIVFVLMGGGAVALTWEDEHLPALIVAWYPGEEGGSALADVLFGVATPGGRLPVTFYRDVADLPAFEDYRMAGRTYRYFTGSPLYPFGYGLSYTTFAYSDLACTLSGDSPDHHIDISVTVTNTGQRAGDEVVQAYLSHPRYREVRRLVGFKRVALQVGESQRVAFRVEANQMMAHDDAGRPLLHGGPYTVEVGNLHSAVTA